MMVAEDHGSAAQESQRFLLNAGGALLLHESAGLTAVDLRLREGEDPKPARITRGQGQWRHGFGTAPRICGETHAHQQREATRHSRFVAKVASPAFLAASAWSIKA
ncbi:hypothetical protein [Streptomyces sp. NPDC002573]|uniref:hypothetical protein n=1 Tax=Streptomyces sp. NPDC002573 TaxID=3364651 RepID=UPI0036C766F3